MSPICLLFLMLTSVSALGTIGTYPDRDKNEPFPKWGFNCENGAAQSPINIEKDKILRNPKATLHLWNLNKHLYSIRYGTFGFSPVFYDLPTDIQLEFSLIQGVFIIDAIHLHWNSEHMLNGKRYDLEVQMFFLNTHYSCLQTGSNYTDGVIVLSMLFNVAGNAPENPFFENLNVAVDFIVKNKKQPGDTIESTLRKSEGKPIILSSLLAGREAVFYRGSYNRPPCMEGPNWVVMLDTQSISQKVIDKLRQFENREGKQVINNYRDTYPLNDRILTRINVISSKSELRSASSKAQISEYLLVCLISAGNLHNMRMF